MIREGERVRIEYLDHPADARIRVRGDSVTSVFCGAARGLFALMVEVDGIEAAIRHDVLCHAETLPELLVEWLGDLVAQKDLTGLVFRCFEVVIDRGGEGFSLRGAAWGEALDPSRHARGAEVKGISYLGLRVEQDAGGWMAECVFDI